MRIMRRQARSATEWPRHLGGARRFAPIWLRYAQLMRKLERREAAVRAYRRVDALRPGNVVKMRIAHQLKLLGRPAEALATYEAALDAEPDDYFVLREAARLRPRGDRPDRLGYVMLGTTGLCNASCAHCPTGKAATAHAPRVPMAMPLFERIIDELVEMRLPILGQIAFGLFGDALVDPHVVARTRYARKRLPEVPISINTNAAAFDPGKHAALKAYDPVIGLHCESLVPETFAELMYPLRLERVIVKYERLLETFPGRVHVSIPAHRRNLAELPEMRRWFEARGAHVFLAPMMSRCAEDRSVFDSLVLDPRPARCSSAILDDLTIDCDGRVLGCCQDFTRAEPIGDMQTSSLAEIVFGAVRARRAAMLDAGKHAELATCSRCFGDIVGSHQLA